MKAVKALVTQDYNVIGISTLRKRVRGFFVNLKPEIRDKLAGGTVSILEKDGKKVLIIDEA